jgi:hypothetical protein
MHWSIKSLGACCVTDLDCRSGAKERGLCIKQVITLQGHRNMSSRQCTATYSHNTQTD